MSTLTDLFTNIANAIRSKTGSQATIVASNFPTAISAIQAGGGELNFEQNYNGSSMLNEVLVKTGTVTISSNRTDLSNLFENCEHLTEVSLFDTSHATNMSNMFSYCSNLTTVPAFNTANVTDFSYMFDNCFALTSVPNFTTTAATNMESMFNGCSFLDSTSLNNILAMCAGVPQDYAGNKYFEEIGLDQTQIYELENLSNYSAAVAAGWSSNGGE